MKDFRTVVEKRIDVLAQNYAKVLSKNDMNSRVDVTGLSDKIMSILEQSPNNAGVQQMVVEEITSFFQERIESFDRRAGKKAIEEGKTEKHKRLMEELRGLSGSFNKDCARDIINNTVVRENLHYLNIAENGVLISPELTNKDNISAYKKAAETAKNFPMQFRPDNMLANRILEATSKGRNTRRILLEETREKDKSIIDDYDKMVAYYLLMGGDEPVKRFSRVEISMKQYGIMPDLGASIMKYGDKLTSKLEELAKDGRKSPQEWDVFTNQVLHSFKVAEDIGNRSVNPQEHQIWEERLIRLGILERRIERPTEQTEESLGESLRESLKVDSKDRPSDEPKQGVLLDSEMLRRAQKAYENTGAIPLGYKLGQDGKTIVSIASTLSLIPEDSTRNKLDASKGNLSTVKKGMEQEGQTTR